MPQPTPKTTKTIGQKEKTTQMDFFDALKKVSHGAIVTREMWDDPMVHMKMNKGKLVVRLDDGQNHPLLVTQEDMETDDWFTVTIGPQVVEVFPAPAPVTTPKAEPPAPPPGTELDSRDKSAPDV
jgi:hypothetical protein